MPEIHTIYLVKLSNDTLNPHCTLVCLKKYEPLYFTYTLDDFAAHRAVLVKSKTIDQTLTIEDGRATISLYFRYQLVLDWLKSHQADTNT